MVVTFGTFSFATYVVMRIYVGPSCVYLKGSKKICVTRCLTTKWQLCLYICSSKFFSSIELALIFIFHFFFFIKGCFYNRTLPAD